MPGSRTVLVLGGGVGGVVAATRLRRLLPPGDRVVLIDRERQHLFQPSLLWVLVGRRGPERIQRPLDGLRRRGIEVLTGEITALDLEARRLLVDGSEITGEAVIVSLGAELAPDAVPGLAAAGHNLYTLSGALGARDALERFHGGRIVVVTAAPAYKCPAAPYEAAMLIESEFRHRQLRDRVQIDFYASEPGPMGVAGPKVSAGVRQMIEQRGIVYHPEHQVSAVDASARQIRFSNEATAGYDLLLFVAPHRAPVVVRESGLVGPGGWIPVDRHTLETSFSSVFAIGDVTSIPLTMGKPLPKAGVFAEGQAEVVARNLAHTWTGRGKPARFNGHGACFLEAGDGKAGFGKGDFYAEPAPRVRLHGPAWWWHLGKVVFEQRWLRTWF